MPRCTIHCTARAWAGARSKTMCLPTRWTRSMCRPVSSFAIAAGGDLKGSGFLAEPGVFDAVAASRSSTPLSDGFDLGQFGHGVFCHWCARDALSGYPAALYHQPESEPSCDSYRCRSTRSGAILAAPPSQLAQISMTRCVRMAEVWQRKSASREIDGVRCEQRLR